MKSFADANSVLSGFVPTDSAEEPKEERLRLNFGDPPSAILVA